MVTEQSISQFRKWYEKLLRFYPKAFRERFGEGMEQTFNDLCRERKEAGKSLTAFVLWMYADTTSGIIRENLKIILMKNKNIIVIALVTIGILLIPFIAMQFTPEVNWSFADFITMGIMIFVTGLLLNLVIRKMGKYRIAAAIVIVALFIWLWVELAVGLFTNWGS